MILNGKNAGARRLHFGQQGERATEANPSTVGWAFPATRQGEVDYQIRFNAKMDTATKEAVRKAVDESAIADGCTCEPIVLGGRIRGVMLNNVRLDVEQTDRGGEVVTFAKVAGLTIFVNGRDYSSIRIVANAPVEFRAATASLADLLK